MDTKKLRQKILDLAIHGKLVPQDPNDEPASVLLERIKAEKERLIKEGKIKRSRKAKDTADTPHYENVPFEVPNTWVWTTLDSICILIEDCCHSTAKNEGNGYPLIRTSNVGIGYLILDNVHRVSETIYKKRNVRATPQANDIIYAREAPAGNAALVKENEYVCLGQRTVLIRPMFVNPKWLTYIINSPTIRRLLINQATGSTVLHVNMESIRSLRLPIPSLTEQNRIVDKIEEIITFIDTIELDTTNLRSAVERIKLEVLSLAFHGKLVPQDPHDEPASELLKRINPKAEIACDNGHYKKLPDGWIYCKLEDIVEYEQPQAYLVNSTDYDDSYATPVLTAGKSFILGYTNETSGLCSNLPVIIFDDFTTESKYVDFEFKVKSSAMKILRVKEGIDINYVYRFMSRTRLISDTHKRYWISQYSKLLMPLPPINEQKRITQKIEDVFLLLDTVSESL